MTEAGTASSADRADVLVVGCGPVGMMVALRSAQRGLSVIAIDRSEEIYPLPRAIGMDEEVQELFTRAGLGAELRACSTPLPGAEFVDAAGTRLVGIELDDGAVGPLGHPPMVTFDQPALERGLRAAAVRAGVDVRLGVDAFGIETLDIDGAEAAGGDSAVAVDIGTRTGDHRLEARWLVAADGAKSTVRSLRGIDLVDQGFDQTWLVVDATLLDPDLRLPRLATQFCDPARVCTFVPGPAAHRRWEFQLEAGETREQVLADGEVERFLAPWGSPAQLRVDRAAVYRFHATVAARFRDGPVFLAGDAAHQMPPFNGQGMCTGMRDAENLSWKLAAVAAGEADVALLDTYDAERRPHAAGQVAHSADAGRLIQALADGGETGLDSGYGQRPFPRLEGDHFDHASGHPLVGRVLAAPATDLPVLPDGWLLLHIESTIPPGVPGSVHAVAVPATAFPGLVEGDAVVLVRPDRYVAAVTTDPATSPALRHSLPALGPIPHATT